MIRNLDISEEELMIVEETLKIKIIDEKYSTYEIIYEINILVNQNISNYERDQRLKRLRHKIRGNYYRYKYNDHKRSTPEDLKKYSEKYWVNKIIINPVGKNKVYK